MNETVSSDATSGPRFDGDLSASLPPAADGDVATAMSPVAAESPVMLTVGQQLRSAREVAAMTVDDIAQATKFSPRQVESLESDDYAALPGMTIIRGFVRSYAKLLRLDADVLLKALDVNAPPLQADVRPPDNMGVAEVPGERSKIGPLLSLAIVLIVAAALLAAWQFWGPKAGAPSSTQVTSSVPSATSAGASNPDSVTGSPDHAAGTNPAFSVAAPGGVALPQPSGGGVADAGATRMGGAGNAAPPLTPDGAVLHFQFEDRSWVEVVDATKRVLHSGENTAGSQLQLSGQAPFEVVVGNAARVKLQYGERTVDLAPHTRAEVARLRLE